MAIENWQWSQNFDVGFQYGHMTTNLIEEVNAIGDVDANDVAEANKVDEGQARAFQVREVPNSSISVNEFPVMPDVSNWEVSPLAFEILSDRCLRRHPKGQPQLTRIRNDMDIRETGEPKQ
ncbi:hypothetical protein GOBAR_DD22038 [Gossypium barbadense]|nr:hypothetical protein GOBAR_DD22038 [Gossypium barbadense]